MDRDDHLVSCRRIVKGLVLISKPEQFLLPVSPADICAEPHERLVYHIIHPVRAECIGCAFDRHCSLVISTTRGAPRTVFLLHVKAYTAVLVDAVVARRLIGGAGKEVSQALCSHLPHHAVGRDSVDAVSPLSGMVRAQLCMYYHLAVRISHHSSSSFSALSWSCSSTSLSFSGTGSPKCAAFSKRLTPSLER